MLQRTIRRNAPVQGASGSLRSPPNWREASHVIRKTDSPISASDPSRTSRGRRRPCRRRRCSPRGAGPAVSDRQGQYHRPGGTDTEVTVGILHSVTGTMAISETGSVEAEQLAIDQINARAACSAARSSSSRRTAPATGRPSPKRPRSCSSTTRSPPSWAAGLRPRARRCCRCSSNITACSIIRRSTRPRAIEERHLYRPGGHPADPRRPGLGGEREEAQNVLPDRLGLYLAAHVE